MNMAANGSSEDVENCIAYRRRVNVTVSSTEFDVKRIGKRMPGGGSIVAEYGSFNCAAASSKSVMAIDT